MQVQDTLQIGPAADGGQSNRPYRARVSDALKERVTRHPLWDCALLRACAAGHLTRDDFAFLFAQYSLFSRSFTRFLNAAMMNLDNDLLRARLCQNLWEESGMQKLEERHSELFRRFLQDGLGVDADTVEHEDYTRYFVSSYLAYCRDAPALGASAFLALGTEAIVPKLYATFVSGLRMVQVEEKALKFFLVHMETDDQHAATLEEIMLSYASGSGWLELASSAVERALDLRHRFFDQIFESIRIRRLRETMARVQARKALCSDAPDAASLKAEPGWPGPILYENKAPRLAIDFSVHRLPFSPEVLDPRIVRIRVGACNERHKHAHETVFVVLEGRGTVKVNGTSIDVGPGDTTFVPRWAMHQTVNTGDTELVVLAVTDYGFTGKLFVGDYDRTARLRRSRAKGGDAAEST